MKIRRAKREELPIIVENNRRMALETEDKQLDLSTITKGAEALFDDPGRGFYMVCEKDGEILGQLMITYEWSDWRDGYFWWIQSVYVNSEARKQGVFNTLYDAVMKMARAGERVCGVRLYVEKSNVNAQKVYERVGMSRTHYDMFEVDFSAEI